MSEFGDADRPSLSVVVITRNEAEDLPGFLTNFSAIADEIIIIDDGSEDKTEAIAKAYGGNVKFISAKRTGDEGFCDQRNKGVTAATCDWLLQVDCDMRLTGELADEIRVAIQEFGKKAYRFRLRQYFLSHECRHGGLQYWNQPWLSRRNAIRWTQKLHERAHIDAPEDNIGQLSNRMVHLNDADFSERMRKNYQYSHLEAERLLSSNKPIRLWHVFTKPFWRAFRSYVLMRGFLDGQIGFVWSLYQFTGTANAYFLAWEKANRRPRSELEQKYTDSLSHSQTSQIDSVNV